MGDRIDDALRVLPDFGRMLHLPHQPNCDRDDLVATEEAASAIFRTHDICVVEEKIDGSQVGLALPEGGVPFVRNKNHVLNKGYGRKRTNAKMQYAPLWNWVTEHAGCFDFLEGYFGETVGVYGEWIYAEHTLRYDLAPADFVAYQIYSPGLSDFVDPYEARAALGEAGFVLPPLLGVRVSSYEDLVALANQPSPWSSRDVREGVVVKYGDGERLLGQFKMRRASFRPREDFNDSPLVRRGRA